VLNKFAGEGRLDAIAKGFKAAPEKILKGIKDLLKKAA
jgi:hypothetical protein